jgi:hypothetical protein
MISVSCIQFYLLSQILAYSSFLEWNPNPEIADAAEKLYGHIDHLELYVGLQAEEAKTVVEGAGLCPGKPNAAFITV